MKKDIRSVILLGSGAIKIGEAGEFDYSGTQAIKALKELGIRVILINPNIATIQTSDGLADEVYFVPITPLFVEKIIIKEKPDGILLSFGGQTALNCGIALHKKGVFRKYHVQVLGTPIESVIATEDREIFAEKLSLIGLSTARGKIVTSIDEGIAFASTIEYPVMLREGFALGGTGSGTARDEGALRIFLTRAFATSSQVIIEECLNGWKELEYEVVRDSHDNCIVVCTMENMDPVGIHTGESIVVAPAQTLTNEEYFSLRQKAIDVIRSLHIIGECNIQFALHPTKGTCHIIEVNARLSRSSALASKATGYPLAYIATKLAFGSTLPSLKNSITGATSAFFEPALDYIVVKIPRWDTDKYRNALMTIGSEMKSVGEVMSIGRTFEEAIQKAARMLNDGYTGVIDVRFGDISKALLRKKLKQPDSMRLFTICSALRAGISVNDIYRHTNIDRWFLRKLEHIVCVYRQVKQAPKLSVPLLSLAKRTGFSDRQIADLRHMNEDSVRVKRIASHIIPFVKRIDTMAGEFPAITHYLYMTYNALVHDHTVRKKEKRVIIIGCGPYAIGTSVEFDWCAVNTAMTLREQGIKAVMVNCNPETVSTDFDMSDYLYFEELTFERILDIASFENVPCIVSVGGQIPNNLAQKLFQNHVKILGTRPSDIRRAEYRKEFSTMLDTLKIAQPSWGEAASIGQGTTFARRIGYPILVRPSFVLSGKGMQVIESEQELITYFQTSAIDGTEHPLLMTRFLKNAVECDFDGVAKNGNIVVFVISEHVESGGVHSGDSTMVLPPPTLSSSVQQEIVDASARLIRALQVTGPFNIQYLLFGDIPYVIECNLRAARSMPFVSKASGVNFIHLATRCMTGQSVSVKPIRSLPYFVVKVPQFSFHKLRGADPVFSVEMHSTGEVAAFGMTPYESYLKAILATGVSYPTQKSFFVSIGGAESKLHLLHQVEQLYKDGYHLYATTGTKLFLQEVGISATTVGKLHEDIHPNINDLLETRSIDFAIVIPHAKMKGNEDRSISDGYSMRRKAIDMGIPLFTDSKTANWFIRAIHKFSSDTLVVNPWSYYQSLYKKGGVI